MLAAWWAARKAASGRLAHGIAVGVGTALLDLALAALLSGDLTISLLLIVSNGGRILAGIMGGAAAARQGA